MSVRGNVVFFSPFQKIKASKAILGLRSRTFFEPFFWQRWWFLGIETHFSISGSVW
jgi:hypothetical protein